MKTWLVKFFQKFGDKWMKFWYYRSWKRYGRV